MKKLLYQKIADNLKYQIECEVLRTGDKLPSLRNLSKENGASLNTVQHAYLELESIGLIESRPKSGYFVSTNPNSNLQISETTKPKHETKGGKGIDSVLNKVYQELGGKNKVQFSLSVPQSKLLPISKLNKYVISAMHELEACGTQYESVQGNIELRRQISKSTYTWGGRLKESDLVTTNGCLNAIAYCLQASMKPGDTLAVESPVYFGILQLAQSLSLKVVELPTNTVTGIEVEALKKTLERKQISACLLISNFSNPMGGCMPEENKKAVVDLLEKYNIPLIEDDIYGDIYFGTKRPIPCKYYDQSGNVLWCSSISKSLAPGYRVGWVAPGKYFDKIIKLKTYNNIASNSIATQTTANFLKTGRYEHHLRNLRKVLHSNQLHFIRAISEYFPVDTKLSAPKGGFVLWLRLNKKVDTMNLFDIMLQHKISFSPGRLFTLQNQYNNCMRISYGMEWTKETSNALKLIGKSCKHLIEAC